MTDASIPMHRPMPIPIAAPLHRRYLHPVSPFASADATVKPQGAFCEAGRG